NLKGGAGTDAGIDRTPLMKAAPLAGGRTSADGGAFSMSLPFWDATAVAALKSLILTSFWCSIREWAFAMLECFRREVFRSKRVLVSLVSNSLLSSPVTVVVFGGNHTLPSATTPFNDCA